MNTDLISAIRAELAELGDEKVRAGVLAYFKEPVVCYGVQTPEVHKVAQRHFAGVKRLGKSGTFGLCEELLKSDYMEEAFIAFDWSYRWRGKYEQADFGVFESWLSRYVNNWAKCDSLCNHSIGAFVQKYPQYVERLKQWARAENRWLRRASAVTLVVPARRGKFLNDVFDIADILLTDRDDLVQKGYGWLLKEAARTHQAEVFDYVMRNRKVMPRTALRYAIEKMPQEMKRAAMERG